MRTTASVLDCLRAYESRDVTFMAPDGSWPIVWERARGAHVWDLEGRRYLDLTSAFGVAAAGHANPRVVRAGQAQMARLLHAMGDVHPHRLKAALARELSRLTFERWSGLGLPSGILGLEDVTSERTAGASPVQGAGLTGKVLFGSSGFEAVEAALKTAILATGRPGVVAFEGAYHGLGYGALTATARAHFRRPFLAQLKPFVRFAPMAQSGEEVEPAEIYTGFGRTGRWFACEHSGVVPDLICLGKALTGGFPLSACVGRADVMDRAWPEATGEAIHTSTFLGHPVGCAMALAQLREIRARRLVARSARVGAVLRSLLEDLTWPAGLTAEVRGLGLMIGLELRHRDGAPATGVVLRLVQAMLERGCLLLPEGECGNVIGFTPPLIVGEADLRRAVKELARAVPS